MFKTADLLKPAYRIAILGATVGMLTACTSVYRNHGYVPSQEDLAEVKVGVDTRDSVIQAVGAPSSGGVLEESGYYYVSTRMRHYGPRKPEVVSRQLVAISFDQRGVVRNIERFSLADGRVIPLERRVTDSSIEDKTFLRQLLGNLGNFNPGSVLNQ